MIVLAMKCFQDMVTKFLVMLATQSDDKLQALRFRLDFNEYYQAKEPILASPQVWGTFYKLFSCLCECISQQIRESRLFLCHDLSVVKVNVCA